MISSQTVLKRWKEYFEKLMNKENDRDPRTETREEVKNALRRVKKSKAVGPDELPVEVWKCIGEIRIEFLTKLFNKVLVGK